MGRSGTAAAKEAADMVLADDNFATLRAAIEEGRRVYDNLVKALSFVLPTSLGQALIIAVAVLAFPLRGGEPLLPVEPVQILWINLIVAVALALPLALEAAEPDLMERPPRDPSDSLLDRPLLVRTLVVAGHAHRRRARPVRVEHDRQLDARSTDARAGPAQTTAVTGGGAAAGALPDHLPVADPPQPRDRPLVQPLGLRGHRRGARAAGPVHRHAPHARGVRLRGARPQALALAAAAALLILPVTWLEERWRTQRGSLPLAAHHGSGDRSR